MKNVEHASPPAQPSQQDPDPRDSPHRGSAMGPTVSRDDGAKRRGNDVKRRGNGADRPGGGGNRGDKGSRRPGRGGERPGDGGPTKPGDAPKETRPLLTWFLLVLIAALLGSSLMLPWKVLGLVFGMAALVLGIVALVKTGSAKLPGLVRVSTTAGLIAALFLVISTGASVLLWPVTKAYEDCMSTALTIQAERTCEEGLRNLEGFLTPD